MGDLGVRERRRSSCCPQREPLPASTWHPEVPGTLMGWVRGSWALPRPSPWPAGTRPVSSRAWVGPVRLAVWASLCGASAWALWGAAGPQRSEACALGPRGVAVLLPAARPGWGCGQAVPLPRQELQGAWD